MGNPVTQHYSSGADIASVIADTLQQAGMDLHELQTTDLAAVDEFHIRGREATLELAGKMELPQSSTVLDIGSGLGGPARTLAETYPCQVTGLDLTPEFCDAAAEMSRWVSLSERVTFQPGDATDLPFPDDHFDAAMTIHVAMNIPNKPDMYAEARRVLRSGKIFAVYDVVQGDGGEVVFPVPWARDESISHLATPQEMETLLSSAGFDILETQDSTERSRRWFEELAQRMTASGPPPVSFHAILGHDFQEMAQNQVRNLTQGRIRTMSYVCRA